MKALVLGAQGTLGSALVDQLDKSGNEVAGFSRDILDITDKESVRARLTELRPEVVFNCVAYNSMDRAEEEQERAFLLNKTAVENICEVVKELGLRLVHYSTGYVFDGKASEGYAEDAQPNPLSVYAQSKYEGEKVVLERCAKYYLIRTNLIFGPAGTSPSSKKSFPDLILELSNTKQSIDFVTDEISSPTYSVDLAKASIALVSEDYPYGIYHLVNEGRASWYDYAQEVFKLANKQKVSLNAVPSSRLVRKAARPGCSVLLNTKFRKLRPWPEALREYLAERKEQ